MTAPSPLPRRPGAGLGFSSSSREAVLAAAEAAVERDGSFSVAAVAREALARERRAAGGMALAAQDVAAIAYGGVVEIITGPSPDAVRVEPVPHDSDWLGRVVVVAYDPDARPHDAPDLLRDLFAHPKRHCFVDGISAIADQCCGAIRRSNAPGLASSINGYLAVFDEWTRGSYTAKVRDFARELEASLPSGSLLAWKPPGAGACRSLALVVRDDGEARDAAISAFRARGWVAGPLRLAAGVRIAESGIEAGHRLDFVGAADLGQDPRIAREGRCCACAIELP